MITQIVFMTEEKSMEAFLEIALKQLLPNNLNFLIITHEGKQDLEKSIPRKLKAWKNNNEIEYLFVIIRDKDSGDCTVIRNNLIKICQEARRDDSTVIIAIHELESWFLGDIKAIESAYDINISARIKRKNIFINPDIIANASQELHNICKDGSKISRAKRIANEMDLNNNSSLSFNYFMRKMIELS